MGAVNLWNMIFSIKPLARNLIFSIKPATIKPLKKMILLIKPSKKLCLKYMSKTPTVRVREGEIENLDNVILSIKSGE